MEPTDQHSMDGYCIHMHAGMQMFFDKSGQVTVSPCCSWNAPFWPVKDPDIFNHPELLRIRKENKENNQLFSKECSLCINKIADHEGNRTGWHNIYNITKPRYDIPAPMHISIKADITCNLACVICNPYLSTTWQKELSIKGIPVRANKTDLKEILSRLDTSQLRTLHIYGGETFLGKTTETILESIRPALPNILLWLDTNCTIMPSKKLINLMSECGRVDLKFSIDGISDAFEYMRYRANWNKVQDIMHWLNENLSPNIKIFIRPTVGILNAHVMNDLNTWYIKNFIKRPNGDRVELEYYPAYETFGFDSAGDDFIKDIKNLYPVDHKIHSVIPTYPSKNLLKIAFNTLNELDARRGTNWRKSLPHLIPYFKD